jgi:hypothetical protein
VYAVHVYEWASAQAKRISRTIRPSVVDAGGEVGSA